MPFVVVYDHHGSSVSVPKGGQEVLEIKLRRLVTDNIFDSVDVLSDHTHNGHPLAPALGQMDLESRVPSRLPHLALRLPQIYSTFVKPQDPPAISDPPGQPDSKVPL